MSSPVIINVDEFEQISNPSDITALTVDSRTLTHDLSLTMDRCMSPFQISRELVSFLDLFEDDLNKQLPFPSLISYTEPTIEDVKLEEEFDQELNSIIKLKADEPLHPIQKLRNSKIFHYQYLEELYNEKKQNYMDSSFIPMVKLLLYIYIYIY